MVRAFSRALPMHCVMELGLSWQNARNSNTARASASRWIRRNRSSSPAMTINGSQRSRYRSLDCSSSIWKFTSRIRAVYSALSMYRDSQNSDSAMRDSISVLSAKYPGILAATALGRIHDQRTLLQRDAGQPPWHDRHVLSVVQAVGPEIHVASGNAFERRIVRGDP